MIVQAGNNATIRCIEAENGALVVSLRWTCLGCNPDSSDGLSNNGLSLLPGEAGSPAVVHQHSASNNANNNRPVDLITFQSDSVTTFHNEGRMRLSMTSSDNGVHGHQHRFALLFTRVATGDSGLYGCLLNDRSHVESVTKLLVQGKILFS